MASSQGAMWAWSKGPGPRVQRREDRLRLEAAYKEGFGPDIPLQEAKLSLHCSVGNVSGFDQTDASQSQGRL